MEIISDKLKIPSPISSSSSGLIIVTPCSPQSPNSPPVSSVATPPAVVMSPCAACKILRRRCADKCVLAPYFPPTDPLKFSIAHKVFGASNIIKLLQEIPESQRADAVSSMVYEANARVRDPVYGSAGAICQLQKQVSDLQAELAKSTAQIVTLQSQHSNLLALFYMQMTSQQQSSSSTTTTNNDQQHLHQLYVVDDNDDDDNNNNHTSFLNFYDDHNLNFDSILEPLV